MNILIFCIIKYINIKIRIKMFNKYLINQKIKFKKFFFFIFFLTLFFFPFRKTKKILNLKRKEERNNKAKQ